MNLPLVAAEFWGHIEILVFQEKRFHVFRVFGAPFLLEVDSHGASRRFRDSQGIGVTFQSFVRAFRVLSADGSYSA